MGKKRRRRRSKRRQRRKLSLIIILILFFVMITSVGFKILNETPEERAARLASIKENKQKIEENKQKREEEAAKSSEATEESEMTDQARQAIEETFNETLQNDCGGYLSSWNAANSDLSVMNLTFIQDVKYMSDDEKQYLMDNIGKKFDNTRQSYYKLGSHIHITFLVEDGTEIGVSKLMSPDKYKLK